MKLIRSPPFLLLYRILIAYAGSTSNGQVGAHARRAGVEIAPSILAGDFGNLASESKRCFQAGCRWLHVDICDGCYVRGSLTFGPQAVAAIAAASPELKLDCHVAVVDPSRYVQALADAGASRFTFQWESLSVIPRERTELALELAQRVIQAGMTCGVCIARATPASAVTEVLESGFIDLVDVLAVEPGFGGQSFDDSVLGKIETLAARHPNLPWVAIDGGVTEETAPRCLEVGANMLIAGTAIFGAPSLQSAVDSLLQLSR
mmetsp:Transcript_69743/g.131253  ORF Transcript_69743/g.131253 Transcript_69743/m.131253 type:complete len:262 (-) Transcript_69743:293-1078(-)